MYLEKINTPEDLKKLPDECIKPLCDEIRKFLIENVTRCGGHLASNLGIVELTLALHKLFSFTKDKLIFDVGHQSYVHKLITGRREGFANLRSEGGVCGFTKRSESEYDAFGAGHSSTSISAALGYAKAHRIMKSDAWTVAVIGDGAFTGGMVYEALENCEKDLRLMIILNDNEMSISENVGKMSKYISDIRSSKYYISLKHGVSDTLNALPFVGASAAGTVAKIKESLKKLIVYDSNFFESMGLRYYGPVDGNDYEKLKLIISDAKSKEKSCIIHITTKKGLGYEPAENNPRGYHAVSSANAVKSELPTFSQTFGNALTKFATHNKKICAVTAAMCDGTGLKPFSEKFPDRFFDVGIAEEHAVTFCAGLSCAGMLPVFTVYSSFLQRAYDNLIHDVALQKLHIILGIDRAGLSPDDGATHHGIYDVAFLSQLADVTVLSAVCTESLEPMLTYAADLSGTVAIRYQKGTENKKLEQAFYKTPESFCKIGIKTYGDVENCKNIIICYGRIADEALKAAEMTEGTGVVLLETLLPNEKLLSRIAETVKGKKTVFVEEGIKTGGAGMIMQSRLSEKYGINIKVMAIETVPEVASLEKLYKLCKIDAESISKELTE